MKNTIKNIENAFLNINFKINSTFSYKIYLYFNKKTTDKHSILQMLLYYFKIFPNMT